jgi:hypothetical protein
VNLLYHLCILFFFGISVSIAQAPDILWTQTYGGIGNEQTWGRSAQQTADGGYVIFGQSNSFGGGDYDFYIVKTDSCGDTMWTRTYGGTGNDFCYSGQQTSDGGYCLVGETNSFGADSFDMYIVKTDSIGDTSWTKMIGTSVGREFAQGLEQLSDKGFIFAGGATLSGTGNGNVYLVKSDSLGDTIWTRTYGGYDDEQAYEVSATSDGGYIIAAWTRSFGAGNYDAYIIKTDSIGITKWTFIYGGTNMDKACDVIETSDGYYLIVGWTYSFGSGYNDAYLMKMTSSGDTLWSKLYGGPYYDGAYSVQETMDGNYIITGGLSSSYSNLDLCFWKVDTSGNILWTLTCGGNQIDYGFTVKQTTDQGYMAAGYTNSFGAGGYDIYLVKTGPEQGINDDTIKSAQRKIINATMISGAITLPHGKRCRIFDIAGRVVQPSKLLPGVYFIEIDGKVTSKVIKVR